MRYVELRRHTDNEATSLVKPAHRQRGDKLSEKGVADAEAIGKTGLHSPYAEFVSTGAERATAMLRILRGAAGQDEIPITTETGLRSAVEDRWREAAKVARQGSLDRRDARGRSDLVEHETRLLGSALRRVAESLPEGGRALVVGHSPTNKAAVYGLVGQTIAAMSKGEGVLVAEDSGRYEVRAL
jgi:Histidine phosphatase superfamily (branch 1)